MVYTNIDTNYNGVYLGLPYHHEKTHRLKNMKIVSRDAFVETNS